MASIKEIIAKYYGKIKDANDPVKKFREDRDVVVSGAPSDSSEENPIARAKNAIMEEASADTSKGLQKLGVDKKYADYALPAASMLMPTLRPTGKTIIQNMKPIKPSQTVTPIAEKLGIESKLSEKAKQLTKEEMGDFGKVKVIPDAPVKPALQNLEKYSEKGANLTEIKKMLETTYADKYRRATPSQRAEMMQTLAAEQLNKKSK